MRVHYGKYCTRGVLRVYLTSRHTPSAIFPVVHKRNWCFYWFIVLWFPLKHVLLCECVCISHSYIAVPIPQLQYSIVPQVPTDFSLDKLLIMLCMWLTTGGYHLSPKLNVQAIHYRSSECFLMATHIHD